jgi:hypothetical protein
MMDKQPRMGYVTGFRESVALAVAACDGRPPWLFDREWLVMTRVADGDSFVDIARDMGVSQARARQLCLRGMEYVRRPGLRAKRLRAD